MVLQLQEVPFLVRAIGTLLKIYWRMELSFSYESLLVEKKNIYIYIYCREKEHKFLGFL